MCGSHPSVTLSSRSFLPCSLLFVRSLDTSSICASSTFASILPLSVAHRPSHSLHYTRARATTTNDSHSTDLRARSKSYSQTLARKLDLRFLRHSQPPHELKLSPCAKSNILIFTQSRRGGCRSGSGGSSGPGNLSLQFSIHLGQWPECNTRTFLA